MLLRQYHCHVKQSHALNSIPSTGALLHSGDTVRIACFCDFQEDRPVLGKQEHEALGQFEWWHTAVGLFEDDRPASDGLWKGWAIE